MPAPRANLEAVATDQKRHDPNAEPAEDVAPEQVHHAIPEVFRRRQARTPQNLRAGLQQRLVAAMEAATDGAVSGAQEDRSPHRLCVLRRDIDGRASEAWTIRNRHLKS